ISSHPPRTQPPLGTNSEHPQHQDTPRKMVAPHPHPGLGRRKMRTRRRTHQTRKRTTKSSPPLDHPPRRNTMSTETTLNVTFFDVNHNMMTLMFGIEEYNRAKHLQATILRHRYWYDFTGQPRRNPLMKPLLHNGKAPRRQRKPHH